MVDVITIIQCVTLVWQVIILVCEIYIFVKIKDLSDVD